MSDAVPQESLMETLISDMEVPFMIPWEIASCMYSWGCQVRVSVVFLGTSVAV